MKVFFNLVPKGVLILVSLTSPCWKAGAQTFDSLSGHMYGYSLWYYPELDYSDPNYIVTEKFDEDYSSLTTPFRKEDSVSTTSVLLDVTPIEGGWQLYENAVALRPYSTATNRKEAYYSFNINMKISIMDPVSFHLDRTFTQLVANSSLFDVSFTPTGGTEQHLFQMSTSNTVFPIAWSWTNFTNNTHDGNDYGLPPADGFDLGALENGTLNIQSRMYSRYVSSAAEFSTNFLFTPVPEPAGCMMGIAALGLMSLRRSRITPGA